MGLSKMEEKRERERENININNNINNNRANRTSKGNQQRTKQRSWHNWRSIAVQSTVLAPQRMAKFEIVLPFSLHFSRREKLI